MGILEEGEAIAASGTVRGTRVGLEHMKSRISEEHYFVLGDVIDSPEVNEQVDVLTICVLVVENGFVLIGKSAPADPVNFDKAKGRVFAYEDALRQLWPLEGYLLRERLWSDLDPEENDDG